MNEKGYQGWTNYETLAVALWIDSGEGSYREARAMAKRAREDSEEADAYGNKRTAEGLLADALKEWIEDGAPDLGASLYLLSGALSEVNWYEIAGHYLSERGRT